MELNAASLKVGSFLPVREKLVKYLALYQFCSTKPYVMVCHEEPLLNSVGFNVRSSLFWGFKSVFEGA